MYNSLHLSVCHAKNYLPNIFWNFPSALMRSIFLQGFSKQNVMPLQKLPWLSNIQEWFSLSSLNIVWKSIVYFYYFNHVMAEVV